MAVTFPRTSITSATPVAACAPASLGTHIVSFAF